MIPVKLHLYWDTEEDCFLVTHLIGGFSGLVYVFWDEVNTGDRETWNEHDAAAYIDRFCVYLTSYDCDRIYAFL